MPLASAAAIAAAISGTTALVQGGMAAYKRRKADSLESPVEDPQQRLELARLRRQQKAFETGAVAKTDQERLNSILKQQSQSSARMSGGGVGAAIAGNAKNTAAIGDVLRKIGSSTRDKGLQAGTLSSALVDKMSNRELELGILKQTKLEGQAAQLQKGFNQNSQAALSYGVQSAGGDGAGDGAGDKMAMLKTALKFLGV